MDDAIQGKPRIIVGVLVGRVVEFNLNFFLFFFFKQRAAIEGLLMCLGKGMMRYDKVHSFWGEDS